MSSAVSFRVRLGGLFLCALIWAGTWSAWAGKAPDSEKVSRPGQYSGYSRPLYHHHECRSVYVPMRDGVKLAVDYCLPRPLPPGEKIPAVMTQTRYWRAMVIPILRIDKGYQVLLAHGYAVVKVDVRGTGASFGTWPYPWSPDEIKDGAEIVDWIVSQPWSDGRVGTYGTSYLGSTAEFLLVNQHPAVKAAVIRYGLFDAYEDIAYPGGILQAWFLDTWNRVDQALDRNDTAALIPMMGLLPFRLPGMPGVKPVGHGRAAKKQLRAAVAEHQNNGDVYAESLKYEFRDAYSENWHGRIEQISPYFYADAIAASGAAIYSYSGWFDGAYTAAAVNRYLTLTNPKKLILGPWPHGGKENISPWRESRKNTFDHEAELLRFFDYHLKGINNGIMEEPPVWYYTMGEEKWKSAASWPPPAETTTFYFSADHALTLESPSSADASDSYQVDYTAGTGHASRYDSLVNLKRVPIGYPDRARQDEKLLVYQSAPLTQDLEVTGHPVVRLYVSSTAPDGHFLVYLEDVAPDGKVSYLTEGMLRGLCRKVSSEAPLYRTAPGVPYHTFTYADAAPLVPGEAALLTFALQPTSVLFRQGHSIRVAIAGADRDHFVLPAGPAPEIKIYRSARYPSAIDLPVVPPH